jgi:glutamine synthetase
MDRDALPPVYLRSAGKNLFFDPDDKHNLSRLAYGFIGGQLEHARALSAIVAPTVNSYKRLVPGYEAPVCWLGADQPLSLDPHPRIPPAG